jgi:hypothetical protein
MKINMIKQRGVLFPESDYDDEVFKNVREGSCEVNIKVSRNPQFHRKVMAFFHFCFSHWKSDREFMDEPGQFDVFRKHLTVIAGYYNKYYTIKNEVRIEAKSIAYSNMSQDEFTQLYGALIGAAMKTIFKGCDEDTENKLMRFF